MKNQVKGKILKYLLLKGTINRINVHKVIKHTPTHIDIMCGYRVKQVKYDYWSGETSLICIKAKYNTFFFLKNKRQTK